MWPSGLADYGDFAVRHGSNTDEPVWNRVVMVRGFGGGRDVMLNERVAWAQKVR